MQEKEIIVTNLSSKVISPKPGATWRAFTVYQIQGNDGITYETNEKDFFDSLAIGKSVRIKFKTETKTATNGKVYTSYKLDLPKKQDLAMGEFKTEIIARIELMEKNILSVIKAIELKAKEEPKNINTVNKEPEQLSLFPDDDEISHLEDEPDY